MLGVAALAATVPIDFARAQATPANIQSGSIKDVEHVIFLMQENRSFDHDCVRHAAGAEPGT
jgi:phospholipase C